MFKLLSKESNIFSIPVYLGLLFLMIIGFNAFNINTLNIVSSIFTFAGVALGYFLFNKINLNSHTHIPLFLYTFLVFSLYSGSLDIGIAISLFINSFILLILTSSNEVLRKSSYMLIGCILALNFVVLPTSWPLIVFVLVHIFATSDRIPLNLFRLFFGMFLIGFSYFCLAFYFNLNSWDSAYFPFGDFKMSKDFYPLPFLIPFGLVVLYGVAQHFQHYNEKSPTSKFRYTFVLTFSLAQLVSILLYMGQDYDYLMLLALPFTIIASRAIFYLPKYWLKELLLWLVVFSLILYKIAGYVEIF